VSYATASKPTRTFHLEQLLQKANSINGIRKLNMQFKVQRRAIKALELDDLISQKYWVLCVDF